MKARAETTCPICRTTILVGQSIALSETLGWTHTLCIIGRKAPMIGWHSGL